jgi:hypothetical protein
VILTILQEQGTFSLGHLRKFSAERFFKTRTLKDNITVGGENPKKMSFAKRRPN